MARIIFRYPAMFTAADTIADISNEYRAAAVSFENDILSAINDWEGVSKDRFAHFITVPVKEYIHETIPSVVFALSEMLRQNATEMQRADQHIADNIPSTLGG